MGIKFNIWPDPQYQDLPKRSSGLGGYPEFNWAKAVDLELKLQEMNLRRKELEIRRIEALARLEEARAASVTSASETRRDDGE